VSSGPDEVDFSIYIILQVALLLLNVIAILTVWLQWNVNVIKWNVCIYIIIIRSDGTTIILLYNSLSLADVGGANVNGIIAKFLVVHW
jgi:hypothetical protein